MENNKVKGKVHFIGPKVEGTSRMGMAWARQSIVIETEGLTRIALEARDTCIDTIAQLHLGDAVEAEYYVSAREWQGKWYNNVNLVSLTVTQAAPAPAPAPAFEPAPADNPEQDLPF